MAKMELNPRNQTNRSSHGRSGVYSDSRVVAIGEKRTLSAAARKKTAAAQRARWAKVKAARKTALICGWHRRLAAR
jgi:hypothetical protein